MSRAAALFSLPVRALDRSRRSRVRCGCLPFGAIRGLVLGLVRFANLLLAVRAASRALPLTSFSLGIGLVVTVVFAAGALLVSALGLWAAVVFLGRLRLPMIHRSGSVTLVLPLTGPALGLDSLLQALEGQSLVPRRLIVGVESVQDPAYRRAADLAHTRRFPIEVVVADQATQCAQKCSNLIAALRRVDAQDEAVVLLDADILPPRWWLSALVTPLLDGSADVVNGYRWPVIAAPTVAAHLAAGIDRAIALLPRLGSLRLTWGGSLGLSPRSLRALEPHRILAATLSDDCAIGECAAARGLRVLTRRALLVPTPVRGGLASVWGFGRRQYQIIRIYRPALWGLALGALSTRLLAWGLLVAHLEQVAARLALGVLIAIAVAGFVVQSLVARRLGMADGPGTGLGQGLLAVLKPVVDLFHWSLVVAALAAGTVRWGHVTYGVSGPYSVTVRSRVPWA